MLTQRSSGILMHITSLPSQYGMGDFGPEAYKFVDFLKTANQNVWQILPLNLTKFASGHSPYNCFSAFALNPGLVSPEKLCQDGYLNKDCLQKSPAFPDGSVNFNQVLLFKNKCLKTAFQQFIRQSPPADYEDFLQEHQIWLMDYALFIALKQKHHDRNWAQWPAKIRKRDEQSLKKETEALRPVIDFELFRQYITYKQYFALKHYANQAGVQIFGDVPIYVTYDSADVWSHPDMFKLTRSYKPEWIAGVPPDYFSETGQLWGNPVYNWERLAQSGYHWWLERMRHNLALFDLLRIDHFRGFEACWEVAAKETTALNGHWVPGPGADFFRTLLRKAPNPAIIVEDLGYITPGVRELMHTFQFPGMKVLQFAFDGDFTTNPYLPHNHSPNSVVYTGTHDNNTTRGWYMKEAVSITKRNLAAYLGHRVSSKDIHWDMIRLALASVSRLAIIPMQDIMGLDASARMNDPATSTNNWRWRLTIRPHYRKLASEMRKLSELYGRI